MHVLKITDYSRAGLTAEVINPAGTGAPQWGVALTSDDHDSGRDGQGLVVLNFAQAVRLRDWLNVAIRDRSRMAVGKEIDMRLKRTGQPGVWKSLDDRWTFIKQAVSGKWEIYLGDEFPECDHGFVTLTEASRYAAKLDAKRGGQPTPKS